MLNDDELTQMLASERWRTPPPPPTARIWAGVSRELAKPARHLPVIRILSAIGALAATLAFGVYVGRATAPAAMAVAPASVDTMASATLVDEPYRRTVEELLGQSAVLLAGLPSDAPQGGAQAILAEQGAQLLATVRLLLDSPVGNDARMHELLGDLEVVLVQVARLQATLPEDEMLLIHDALNERDIVPRLRSAVVDYTMRSN